MNRDDDVENRIFLRILTVSGAFGACLGILASGFVAFLSPMRYEYKAALRVSPVVGARYSSDELQNLLIDPAWTRRFLADEAEVMKSDRVASMAAASMRGLSVKNDTVAWIRECTNFELDQEHGVILMTVLQNNPETTKEIATSLVASYQQFNRENQDRLVDEMLFQAAILRRSHVSELQSCGDKAVDNAAKDRLFFAIADLDRQTDSWRKQQQQNVIQVDLARESLLQKRASLGKQAAVILLGGLRGALWLVGLALAGWALSSWTHQRSASRRPSKDSSWLDDEVPLE